jgi:hypothetical protein
VYVVGNKENDFEEVSLILLLALIKYKGVSCSFFFFL